MTDAPSQSLLTMDEAAAWLRISRPTLYRRLIMVVPAKIRTIKIGGHRLVPLTELEAYIQRQLEAQHGQT